MVRQREPRLTAASEKYLEAIFRIEKKNGEVRVTDLAKKLGLKKGTVSGTVKALKIRNVIDYTPYRSIRLTAEGHVMAKRIVRRNRILEQFLSEVLNIDQETSSTAARRIGAGVDDALLDSMRGWLKMKSMKK